MKNLYLRNLIKEIMKSQNFEICNRPMPRIVYSNKNCYQPFWNKIIVMDDNAIAHELVHSLQPDNVLQNNYVSYKKDYKSYIAQECEKQAYAIEDFLRPSNGNMHGSWNILPKYVGRRTKLKINSMIRCLNNIKKGEI